MRIRRKPWAKKELAVCDYYIEDPTQYKENWKNKFINKQPLHLELGCGKGGFIAKKGILNPNINYLAVDIKSDMLGVGRRNISKLYKKEKTDIKNIKLLCHDIERIHLIFSKKDTINRIYINFCNPWPKPRHKKRRLTHPKQLIKYKEFLSDNGEIHFKTDDDELFNDSLNYFKESGFIEKYVTYDLHNSSYSYNIQTEHEKHFSEKGIKIKFCIAILNN